MSNDFNYIYFKRIICDICDDNEWKLSIIIDILSYGRFLRRRLIKDINFVW